MKKQILSLILVILACSSSYGLESLPLGLIESSAHNAAPVQTLLSITRDSRYVTCRKDLEHLLANLSPKDLKEIRSQAENFQPEKLSAILKAKVQNAKGAEMEVDDFMKFVSILIPHGKMKCQISIYPKLEIDQLRSNVDPTAEDLKIDNGSRGVFEVEATLVGVSATAEEGSQIHFDPSKASTILKRLDVHDMDEQMKLIEQLHEQESPPAPATRENRSDNR